MRSRLRAPPAPNIGKGGEPPSLAIRRMLTGDLAAVMELERRAFDHPWSTELFERELLHDWSTILLAERQGQPGTICGFVIYWTVHDEIHILNIAADPQWRRRGVGKALMVATLEQAIARAAKLVTLEVRRSNLPAISLYRGLGFRQVGMRPNYYMEEGEDALVMNLDL